MPVGDTMTGIQNSNSQDNDDVDRFFEDSVKTLDSNCTETHRLPVENALRRRSVDYKGDINSDSTDLQQPRKHSKSNSENLNTATHSYFSGIYNSLKNVFSNNNNNNNNSNNNNASHEDKIHANKVLEDNTINDSFDVEIDDTRESNDLSVNIGLTEIKLPNPPVNESSQQNPPSPVIDSDSIVMNELPFHMQTQSNTQSQNDSSNTQKTQKQSQTQSLFISDSTNSNNDQSFSQTQNPSTKSSNLNTQSISEVIDTVSPKDDISVETQSPQLIDTTEYKKLEDGNEGATISTKSSKFTTSLSDFLKNSKMEKRKPKNTSTPEGKPTKNGPGSGPIKSNKKQTKTAKENVKQKNKTKQPAKRKKVSTIKKLVDTASLISSDVSDSDNDLCFDDDDDDNIIVNNATLSGIGQFKTLDLENKLKKGRTVTKDTFKLNNKKLDITNIQIDADMIDDNDFFKPKDELNKNKHNGEETNNTTLSVTKLENTKGGFHDKLPTRADDIVINPQKKMDKEIKEHSVEETIKPDPKYSQNAKEEANKIEEDLWNSAATINKVEPKAYKFAQKSKSLLNNKQEIPRKRRDPVIRTFKGTRKELRKAHKNLNSPKKIEIIDLSESDDDAIIEIPEYDSTNSATNRELKNKEQKVQKQPLSEKRIEVGDISKSDDYESNEISDVLNIFENEFQELQTEDPTILNKADKKTDNVAIGKAQKGNANEGLSDTQAVNLNNILNVFETEKKSTTEKVQSTKSDDKETVGYQNLFASNSESLLENQEGLNNSDSINNLFDTKDSESVNDSKENALLNTENKYEHLFVPEDESSDSEIENSDINKNEFHDALEFKKDKILENSNDDMNTDVTDQPESELISELESIPEISDNEIRKPKSRIRRRILSDSESDVNSEVELDSTVKPNHIRQNTQATRKPGLTHSKLFVVSDDEIEFDTDTDSDDEVSNVGNHNGNMKKQTQKRRKTWASSEKKHVKLREASEDEEETTSSILNNLKFDNPGKANQYINHSTSEEKKAPKVYEIINDEDDDDIGIGGKENSIIIDSGSESDVESRNKTKTADNDVIILSVNTRRRNKKAWKKDKKRRKLERIRAINVN